MFRKELIAMILAGGQGSRLLNLTKEVAKPAVYFGGKYRIIDFALSNCTNSGIDTVGILTQYQPLVLNSHIGIGASWDLDRNTGGVSMLPPFMSEKGGEWYKGTANAIYQNINYIDGYNPENVLILSGDHIYKMDYSKMLDFHVKKNADATLAVIEVPWEETSRFGIMNTNEDQSIYEFDEKPSKPKSNLASMGIYIFNWKVLREYLINDEMDSNSSNDFGKNVIPSMLNDCMKMFAYPFQGYWKDVGTIESLWEANMDMLKLDCPLNMYDKSWKIYSPNPVRPPHYIAKLANIKNSLVGEGCIVKGEVYNSILFPGVTVEENSIVKDSVIMPRVKIDKDCVITRTIVGYDSLIGSGSTLGKAASENITLIGDKEFIPENSDMI